ncbi:SGNH/GDSL hydrolase family protein [Aquimarina algiphila]|uniref:SGNH/GDSL hydrolase family protein n=1 Tax=Aquimarina algiphila TaxID=2047982 RepID=A0A554VD43_9FLAO|nr:SGNH/GDSL hydrolase family protein [Aquimarina algiphila]TSE04716.1 SGNH/GDSL hydrolase family protein [Aquimarina algiphila]
MILKSKIKRISSVLFLTIVLLCPIRAQELPLFKDGDVVALIGDSITHGGSFHTFLQIFNATQFPNQKVSYFNGGVAGDNTPGTIDRLEKDILIHKPNHAIIMLGMNDVGRWLYPGSKKVDAETLKKREDILKAYTKNMQKLSALLVERGVQLIFTTPSIYDQTADIERKNNFGINDGLIDFGKAVRSIAEKYDAPIVDFNTSMLAVNKKIQAKDKTATIVGHDRIHPGDEGHLVMAYEIIKTVIPVVFTSNIEIDAKTNMIITTTNCKVDIKDGIHKFSVMQNALPFPVKESLRSTEKLILGTENITRENFSVMHLNKGKYKLLIDDIEVGIYSHKELKSGIDLSRNSLTPQYKQAEKVSDLCFQYKNTNDKLRTIAATEFRTLKEFKGPNTYEAKKAFLEAKNEKSKGKSWYFYEKKKAKEYFEVLPKQDSLWKALDTIRDKIYTSNKPVIHTYKLIKI